MGYIVCISWYIVCNFVASNLQKETSKFAIFGYKPYNKGEAKLIDQNEAIIDRLKALKVKSGKTAAQIAKECDIPESTVTRILSGKTPNPTISTIILMIWRGVLNAPALPLTDRREEIY